MRVYLDNNATTKIDPLVKVKMQPFFEELYGNPNSLHQYGMEVRPYLNQAMGEMYDALNVPDADDILITSCATESNNAVLKGVFFKHILKNPEKNHIVTSSVEHPAILETLMFLSDYGVDVTYVDVDENGGISAEAMKAAVTDRTVLISMMWANNETPVARSPPAAASAGCADLRTPVPVSAVSRGLVGELPREARGAASGPGAAGR